MSVADKFLQFPLCALASPGEPRAVLEAIISYGLIEAGAAAMRKRDRTERQKLCAEYGLARHEYDSWALAAETGARLCNITLGSRDSGLKRHSALAVFVHEWEQRHGTDA